MHVLDPATVMTVTQALSHDKLVETLLFDTNVVGIFLWDFDGRILQANDAFLHIVGYERGDLAKGLRWSDLTPPDLLERQAERVEEHKNTGRLQAFEKEYFRKDGSRVPVLVAVSRFEERENQGVGFVLDLTERKRAEQERRMHVWFLESMDRVNRAMQRSHDLEQMVGGVLDAVLEIFACDRAWLVHPCEPQAASWRVIMERVRPGLPSGFAQHSEVPTDASAAATFEAARAARGLVLDVPAEEARRFAVRSRMAMAIDAKGDAPYLFGLHQCSRERSWTADEQRLFEEIGRRLTDALSSLIAARRVRESERRLEAAQRLAHVGWWERNYATGEVSLSDEVCRIFGLAPLDLPERLEHWANLVHPEDRHRIAASDMALGGDVEFRVVRPDGTVRVVRSQGDVTSDEAGRPIRQFGAMQDVTELHRAEQELRARQDMLDLAQKAARAVAFDWSIGDRENDDRWPPELETMHGVGPGAYDPTYQGWKKLILPDDRPSVEAAIERAHESGDLDVEYRVLHEQGAVRYLHAKGRMFFDGAGCPIRIVGFMTDVTDRRNAEEELRAAEARFRTFVDRATDAFFLMDGQYRFVDVNRQACQGLGLTREELIGLSPRDIDVELDARSIERLSARARSGEIITFETRHRRKDGTTFPVEIRTGTFKQGGEDFYLALARDISERKRVEEELRVKDGALRIARDELARVSRVTTLGELTASIAHEVNQPIGAMVANAAACARWLAADPPETTQVRRVLESIASDGRRAGEIIARVRALVKRQPARRDDVDVNRKIAQVIELAADEVRRHGIVLRTELVADLPPVKGDRVQLQQVLLNLILNAIEAMSAIRDRSRELTVASRYDGAEGILVEVGDTGPGLDPEHADRLFEPFFTTKADGLGMGLAISRSIVEAHGGRLWVDANKPYGAIFRFSVPVADGRAMVPASMPSQS